MAAPPASAGEEDRDASRRAMVREVEATIRETAATTGRSQLSPQVVDALLAVPRHRFVPPGLVASAYDNRALPIGHGQTISQPTIVALMTDLAAVQPGDVVLEIGTGSGYQAAVLSRLAARVLSIEIVEPLGREAAARLAALGYANVEVAIGDGYRGWPERAPFDAIVVTAGAPHVPQPLVEQLKPGGRLVIPLDKALGQELVLIVKRPDGTLQRRTVLPVRFVPLTGSGVRGR
ncbi:MAG TPA: protein-L-isoaspartate(D-aspartate) O-methyltransferase [Casimicrobiaceae bacterium]|nr:protein-L-isoaspartate(D-aspartate) O-methyltransferase [Casimicrobiaceae bacterium]